MKFRYEDTENVIFKVFHRRKTVAISYWDITEKGEEVLYWHLPVNQGEPVEWHCAKSEEEFEKDLEALLTE